MFQGLLWIQPDALKNAQETNAALANSDEFIGELLRRLETDGSDPESSPWGPKQALGKKGPKEIKRQGSSPR